MSIPIHSIPLLAANEVQAIFVVLVLLFSFIGFIKNLVKGNAANQQRQARARQQRRPGELQNEIDDFLKDVLGEQPAKRPEQREQVEFRGDDLVVVDDSEARRQQAQRERQERERRERERRQREARQREDRERNERLRRQQDAERRRRERGKQDAAAPVLFDDEAQRPSKTLKDRHLESTLESHVQTYMNHAVEEQRLGRGTVAPIPGEGLAAVSSTGAEAASPVAQQLRALLKSQQGVRQAILVNEILSKPKGLQSS